MFDLRFLGALFSTEWKDALWDKRIGGGAGADPMGFAIVVGIHDGPAPDRPAPTATDRT